MKKLKLPKFTLFAGRPKKLQATTASRRAPASESYYDEEPKTNLSSAFIVVLVLHVVAVGGIYAFNSLRASRDSKGPSGGAPISSSVGTPLAAKTSAPASASDAAPAKSAPKPVAPPVVQDSRKAAFLAAKTEPAPSVAAVTNSATRSYTVTKGDTATSVAKKFGMSSAELLKLNKIDDPKKMQIGQTLKVSAKKN